MFESANIKIQKIAGGHVEVYKFVSGRFNYSVLLMI